MENNPRYPIKTEFSIIDQCINKDKRIQYIEIYKYKKDICINAYSQTIKEVSYDEYKSNNRKFIDVFYKYINQY